jgi:hypothetical protein
MKGKTLLSLAIAIAMILAIVPLASVKASGPSIEIIFNDKGTSTYDPAPPTCTNFGVTVHITDSPPIVQWMVRIEWDPAVLSLVGDPAEGPWLKGTPPRSTMFLYTAPEPGRLPETFDVLLVAGTSSGSGDLMYLTFHVDNAPIGDSYINIYDSALVDEFGNTLDHARVNGLLKWPVPEATPPHADFTPPTCTYYYVGSTVELVSTSTGGIDTLPSPHACPITSWTWDIDLGNDGSIDFTLIGETASFVCDAPGDVGITLTVVAPDTIPPSAPTYVDHDSAKHVIHQVVKPVGPAIDVYTERGGQMPGAPSDAFGPQEEVCVFAKVTYNDEPVEYKPVAFEIIDPNGASRDYRTAFTDEFGIASVCFRIPWQGTGAEDVFGTWTIVGTVSISEQTVTDTCAFKFGYILSFRSIIVEGSPLYKGDSLSVSADIQNIAFSSKDAFLTIVLYDNCGVPIGKETAYITVFADDGLTPVFGITIPRWAFVGAGKVYVNLFTGPPVIGGVPYCPEGVGTFEILKTPP